MKHGKFWARLLAAVCVLALILPTIPTAFAASYPYDVISMDDVNMRSRANTSSLVLKKIKEGATVTILGSSGDFYRVKYDGKTGYAMKAFIDGTDPSADAPFDESRAVQAPPAIYTYPYDTVVLQKVKLRKTAEAEGEVIVMLQEGSVVEVINRTGNGFAKVKVDGKNGYVVETHINLANIPAPVPETEPTPTPVPGSDRYETLAVGSSGNAVTALQSVLAELGYMEEKAVDGKFGTATQKALKTFQKRNGLKQSGEATPDLQLLMYEGTPKDFKGYRQYVKTVAPVPNALIREGGKGDAVLRLQARLRYLGYYEGENTGVFDKQTIAAYKMFEGRNGLNADGIADTEDQKILYGENALASGVEPTPTPISTPMPTRTLRRGDTGEDVKSVQRRLQELGYYTGAISGNYNSATENAVLAFQKKSSLSRDGIVGPITRTVLYGQYALHAQDTAQPEVSYEPITRDNVVVIRSGSIGQDVMRLQKRLQELGYYTSRQDGVYLTDDIEAVRAFQRANGLTVDGKAGYDTQTCLYGENPVAANNTSNGSQATQTATLRFGSEGSDVKTLQNRLIALGYLSGTADGIYGKNTKAAVKEFQKKNNLNADGVAGALTQEALYSSNVQDNKLSTTTTLRIGTISDAVADLQNRLIALGYLTGKADGNFGTKTSLALIAFQRANGLTADGIAGAKTLKKLNSSNVTSANANKNETTVPGCPDVSYVNPSQVRYANWYTEVRAKVRLLPNATIYDFTSGISWKVNMFSFGAHADAEPINATETANMIRAFGGKNTWTPKAVWVVLSDGTVYMASTHDMEHQVEHNLNNNFKGHVCIHFPRTQSQVQSIGPYATSHQKAIDLGWQATLQRAK